MPKAASLAVAFLERYKDKIGEVALIPSGNGAFEVNLNGESIHSKLETGRFPIERALVGQIASKL